jgi:hypothetical protein
VLTSLLDTTGQTKIRCKLMSNSKPVIYANISFTSSNKGTITNEDGIFELFIKNGNKNEVLRISCIGFQTKRISISSLIKIQKKKRLIYLYLQKQAYNLQEITVSKQEILKDAKQIFANAINELPNLLDHKPNIGKYYYRQSHQLDTTINRLIETAVSVYDPGTNHDIKQCQFNINQVKSSLDNRNIDYKELLSLYLLAIKKKRDYGDPTIKKKSSYKDTLIQKHLIGYLDSNKASFSKFFTSTNMIRSTQKGRRKKSLRINPHFKNGRPIITKSFIKEHRFKLDTIMMHDEEPIYKIKILPNRKYSKIKYQEHILIPIGTAYIRVKDFAFLDLDYGYINNPNHKNYNGHTEFYFRFKIKMKEFQNKFYLSYLYSNRFDYNSNLRRKRRLIQELINTEIISNQDSVSKIYKNLKWDDDQYKQRPYNKEFWRSYSVMMPTLQEQDMKSQLENELLKRSKKR